MTSTWSTGEWTVCREGWETTSCHDHNVWAHEAVHKATISDHHDISRTWLPL
jgi:hypothetical protein